MLRDFLKNKDKRHKRDVGKKMFSRKLGGTHNNQKTNKRKHLNKSYTSKRIKRVKHKTKDS